MKFRARSRRDYETPSQLPAQVVQPAWLPGLVEVQVAGETYHRDAIQAAQRKAHNSDSLMAVLMPEPLNPHDPNAVAVYVEDRHIGYLPAAVAGRVHSTLHTFSYAHGGRLVSCTARISEHSVGPQVVLLLDTTALGVAPEVFEDVPDLARETMRLLDQLRAPALVLTGVQTRVRSDLASAENILADSFGPADLVRVRRRLLAIADHLERAADPLVTSAWLGVARASRYQSGQRNETLAAYVRAIYFDRANVNAWCELLDYVCAAPYIPMLLKMIAFAPPNVRPVMLDKMLATSDGRDRLGRMSREAGNRLRSELLRLAESQQDDVGTAILLADAGWRAHKQGDADSAIAAWRRALASGSTDAKIADRVSIWLVKRGEHAEAASVIRQALAVPIQRSALTDRLEKRLVRCQRA